MKRIHLLGWLIFGVAVATLAVTVAWGWQVANTRQDAVVVDGAVLGRVVTASRIDAYNQPLDELARFSPDDEAVYVVAEALHVEQGATLFARWTRNGQAIGDSIKLVPSVDYRDTPITFHFENLGGRLRPGTYQVTLMVNGQPATTNHFVVAQRAVSAR